MNSPYLTRRLLLGAAATAIVSGLTGYAFSRSHSVTATESAAKTDPHAMSMTRVATAAATPLLKDGATKPGYTCPMHPEIVQDHPGSCPICGMTLVKLEQQEGNAAVRVDTVVQQRMGVALEPAQTREMHKTINAYATLGNDESLAVSVNPKVEGWIKRLHVQGVGQRVVKGQVLYEIYSPELQQRERDYIDLLTRRDALAGSSMEQSGPNAAMLGSIAKERFRTRERLLEADVPLDIVEVLEKNRRIVETVPVRARQDGVITAISAREGSYVNPMQTVVSYVDTQRVWAEITLYPDQLSWVRNGDQVQLRSSLDTTAVIKAKLDLGTLQIDPVSRTAKLRLSIANAGPDFRAGAYAEAAIRSGARQALCVPRDALIRTGHGNFVVLATDSDHFRNVQVQAGMDDEENVEIVRGLRAGDKVAVNAQFLLDAAGSLQAMQHRNQQAAAQVGMGDMHTPSVHREAP